MTAIAFVLNKKNHSINETMLNAIHEQNSRYGIDHENTLIDGNLAFSYQAFWTTPEEKGESQPLELKDKYYLLWDGRIDNREDIYSMLVSPNKGLDKYSDANLFLAFYADNPKQAILEKVIGSYTFIIVNRSNGDIHAGRDAMGGRMLVIAEDDEWLCLSTTTHAINAHPNFKFVLDDRTVSERFAFLYADDNSTFSSNVKQILPGYEMTFSNGNKRICKGYLPESKKRIVYKDRQDYISQFKELFELSVSSRLRTTTPISSMVSGGLDSLPITLCAKKLVEDTNDIYGVTWAFDKLEHCDERKYFEDTFIERGIHLESVNCDDAYPFNPKDNWVYPPDNPIDLPYRAKHQRAYERIKSVGSRVCLSGMAGDDLYANTDLIFWEHAKKLKLISAFKEVKKRSVNRKINSEFIKRHFFWYTSLWYKFWGPKTFSPDYLTDYSKRLIGDLDNFLESETRGALRPKQYQRLVGTYFPNYVTAEKYFANEYDVEVRYPLRDRRLIEFMLSIPSEFLESNGVTRPIIREAFSGFLPNIVKNRSDKTLFSALLAANNEIWDNGINKNVQLEAASKFVKFDLIRNNRGNQLRTLVLTLHLLYFDQWIKSVDYRN